MKTVTIGIYPPERLQKEKPLLEFLQDLYSVRFESCSGPEGSFASIILFGATPGDAAVFTRSGHRCLLFATEGARVSSAAEVSFPKSNRLPHFFWGKAVRDDHNSVIHPIALQNGDAVVAQRGEDAIWACRQAGAGSIEIIGFEPPRFAEGEYPHTHFQRDNFVRLLPLIQFVRQFSPWQRPGLRANLMFDDPNLHRKTYGYVRYPELVRHARAVNYHASFATVPFDGWYIDRGAAALFRENADRISLLVHGNNHTFAELAQPYRNGERFASMAQALQRIRRMEQRSGVHVSRVMAAPHGGCSLEMADVLLKLGFEGASISRWSLMHHNPGHTWYPTFGFNIGEFLGPAFPIIPRFKLAKEREMDIFLMALLERPIIMVGHHDDLREGLQILEYFATRINSLGTVRWLDTESIARSNFCTHTSGDSLHIKTYSRRVRVTIPPGINWLCLHKAWNSAAPQEDLEIVNPGNNGAQRIPAYAGEPIPVSAGEVEIQAVLSDAIDPHTVPVRRTSLWGVTRRAYCEIRDRSLPFVEKFKGRGKIPVQE
jgi:hypothetical protein